MSRAGSIHKDTSGLWSFAVDTAPLGAPRRQVIAEIAEWLDKPVETTRDRVRRAREETWLSQATRGKAEELANRSCGTGIRGKETR